MTLSFTNINIMFRSCMYTLSSILLSFPYFKTFFTKFSNFKNPAVFPVSGWPADRHGRPAPVPGRARLCTSVGWPPGSTDCKQLLSGFLGRPPRSTARRKLCFLLEDGRPDRSTRANGSLPAELAADRPGRPPSLQQPNGSFLFCAILKSVFQTAFWQTFFRVFQIFFRANKV